jgi:hypothetical protein
VFITLRTNSFTEGAYHGCEKDFLTVIAPLLDALNDIGGLEPVSGYGTHPIGWLDAIAYANNNDLITGVDSGVGLATPLNYTEVRLHFQIYLYLANLLQHGNFVGPASRDRHFLLTVRSSQRA